MKSFFPYSHLIVMTLNSSFFSVECKCPHITIFPSVGGALTYTMTMEVKQAAPGFSEAYE